MSHLASAIKCIRTLAVVFVLATIFLAKGHAIVRTASTQQGSPAVDQTQTGSHANYEDSSDAIDAEVRRIMGSEYGNQGDGSSSSSSASSQQSKSTEPAPPVEDPEGEVPDTPIMNIDPDYKQTIVQINRNNVDQIALAADNVPPTPDKVQEMETKASVRLGIQRTLEENNKYNFEDEQKRNAIKIRRLRTLQAIKGFGDAMISKQEQHKKAVAKDIQFQEQEAKKLELQQDWAFKVEMKHIIAGEQANKKEVAQQQQVLKKQDEQSEKQKQEAIAKNVAEQTQKQKQAEGGHRSQSGSSSR